MEEQRGIAWRNVIAIALSWAIWLPFQRATVYYDQLFLLGLGATPFIVAIIQSVSIIILSFARIPGGYLADRYGRAFWIKTMTFAIALSYLIFALAPSWQWYLIGVLICNAALFYQPAISAILSDSIPSRIRGRGITTINFVVSLIGLASPVIAMHFIVSCGVMNGQRTLYFLAFLTGVSAGIIRVFLLKDVVGSERGEIKISLKDLFSGYIRTLKEIKDGVGSFLAYIVAGSMARGFLILTPLYVLTYLAIGYEFWGYLMLLNSVVSVIMLLPAGWMLDSLGRRRTAIIRSVFLLLASSALVVASIKEPKILLIAWAISSGIQLSMLSGIRFSIIADSLPADMRAKGYAITQLMAGASMSISSLIAGALYGFISPRIPFIIAFLAALATLASSLRIRETLETTS